MLGFEIHTIFGRITSPNPGWERSRSTDYNKLAVERRSVLLATNLEKDPL